MKIYAVEILGEYSKEKQPYLGNMLAVLIADHKAAVGSLEKKLDDMHNSCKKAESGLTNALNRNKELLQELKDYKVALELVRNSIEHISDDQFIVMNKNGIDRAIKVLEKYEVR